MALFPKLKVLKCIIWCSVSYKRHINELCNLISLVLLYVIKGELQPKSIHFEGVAATAPL